MKTVKMCLKNLNSNASLMFSNIVTRKIPDGSCHCSVDMYGSDEESLGYEAAENLIRQGAKTVINALN